MRRVTAGAMCDVLQNARSTFYYEAKRQDESELEELTKLIGSIFTKSRKIYVQRKIKAELKRAGWTVSRRRIKRIMAEHDMVSKYKVAQFKPSKSSCNESETGNTLDRNFDQDNELSVVVSNLTYIRVNKAWHFICVLVDLYNREIIGFSAGPHKTADLVKRAFASVSCNLNRIEMFHTDRGTEFKNHVIDQALDTFGIIRSFH